MLLDPAGKGERVVYSRAQIGTLYEARDLLQKASDHAGDGCEHLAAVAVGALRTFLGRYPVEWVDPKPAAKPKPK